MMAAQKTNREKVPALTERRRHAKMRWLPHDIVESSATAWQDEMIKKLTGK
ncbi:hypothetical protein HMPREF0484_0962 [Klebsiella pneumoniae subsp. rhinoscleromatis ATCC 13884]|nr:hypothetical protein HMPREF0484_0962 [Klebsiella pneumoniae subsp. rhinoscleromatis ATCC 13884]